MTPTSLFNNIRGVSASVQLGVALCYGLNVMTVALQGKQRSTHRGRSGGPARTGLDSGQAELGDSPAKSGEEM